MVSGDVRDEGADEESGMRKKGTRKERE